MCKNYGELDFRHFVIDKEGNVFGSARVSGTGRIANFLINGDVKQQSGDSWQCLESESAQLIRSKAESAYNQVPVYRSASFLVA